MLVHKENLHAYTMFARTEDDKNKWIEAIKEALNNEVPSQRLNSSHDPVMHTFLQPSSCQYCHKLLKGLFYQGYLCQKCQRCMHKECISLLSKCGPNSLPPSLPPRPPSLLVPSPTHSSLARLSSTLSLTEELPPQTPIPINHGSGHSPGPDYVNTRIEEHSWFVGAMDREQANSNMKDYPVGTYLVRARVQAGEQLGHALSLRTVEDTKHMKINVGDHAEWGTKCYLSESRVFRSTVELVSWYSHHSLKESFSGLDMTLKFAFKDLELFKACYDFNPDQAESNMLPFRSGDLLAVIDTMGGTGGWWKAVKDNRIGYIPKDFVSAC